MENPVTPAGIEPATYRFVAQLLNHCATAVFWISGSCHLKEHVSSILKGQVDHWTFVNEHVRKYSPKTQCHISEDKQAYSLPLLLMN